MVFYHEHSISEAAEIMGVSLGTARTHYERGKEGLRKRLEDLMNMGFTQTHTLFSCSFVMLSSPNIKDSEDDNILA